ncbi:uncharacterized protein LOC108152998 [Drosophila miranda]|uniref:uncharacterized protein LOC108152998 n=1 Tax=Drosophila miranda TaxID=7229 RepID=UPI0007E80CFF|nr:uncharacterized protein LOC108152998 [Drosophila miranda]
MPRSRNLSLRQAQRKVTDQEEKVRLAQVKAEAALEQMDEFEKRAKHQVGTQTKRIRAQSDNHLLQMKISDFLNLKLKYFTDYKWKGPEPSDSRARNNSVSTDRGRCRTRQCSQLPRPIVQ